MKYLVDKLSYLHTTHGVAGIKQSFEDEGVSIDDVVTMRRITELCGLPLFVKIGGCEAKTDINQCIRLGVDALIAPMVETPFALSKYVNSVSPDENIKLLFVCESKTAYQNLKDILSTEEAKRLSGVVVGRSDFCKSNSLSKSKVDCASVCKEVEEILTLAKSHDLVTTMGGNISTKSVKFIKSMYEAGYLDKIETRNVIIELTPDNITKLDTVIQDVLSFEISWLKYKSQRYSEVSDECIYRAGLLESRR